MTEADDSWRLVTRDGEGNEDVHAGMSRAQSIARARDYLLRGHAIIRLESEDGEIIEGKQLQELLAGAGRREGHGTTH